MASASKTKKECDSFDKIGCTTLHVVLLGAVEEVACTGHVGLHGLLTQVVNYLVYDNKGVSCFLRLYMYLSGSKCFCKSRFQ